MKKWIFNPFVYVAGGRSLAVGTITIIITALVASLSKTHFNGVIDIHYGADTSITYCLLEGAIDWLCLSVFLFGAGKLFSQSSIRAIDVAGTQALARWPALMATVPGFFMNTPPNLKQLKIDEVLAYVSGANFWISTVIVVICSIWMIALMYNAFSVSCNLRGGKGAGCFIGALILAEISSKFLVHFLYHHS